LVVCWFVPVVAGTADELSEGMRVGAGGLLEQAVEQQLRRGSRPGVAG
jgi:hypothetical protein